MENINLIVTGLSLVLFAGVVLNRFSKFLKMPILICFLGVGVLCGPYGLNFIGKLDMKTVQTYGEIAICFIMFAGGLQTSFKAVRSVFTTGTILANAGVFLTALLSGLFLHWMSHMSLFMTVNFSIAFLLACTFASTDAAAVFAILRGQKASISPKLQSLLEYESGSNDPAAFLLTSVMIPIAFSQQSVGMFDVSWKLVSGIVWGIGAGSLIGFAVGVFGQWFYNWVQSFLEYDGLRVVVAIGIVLFCFGIAHLCFEANPLMACYIAGITMGNMRFNYKRTFVKFHDGFSWLMQILLFTILGTFFDYRMLFNVRNMVGAVLTALVLMFIARPIAVMLCMIGSPFTMRERIFTSWVGIRGSAPIMLAAMVAASVPANLSTFGNNLFYGVFTVVLLSILIQGSTLMWVAKKLGLAMPYEEKTEELLEYDEREDGRELYQFTVHESCAIAGKNFMESRKIILDALRNSGITDFPVLLMIRRNRKVIQPGFDEKIQAGDVLTFLGKQEAMFQMHRQFFPDDEYTSSRTFRQLCGKFWNDAEKRGWKIHRAKGRK